MKILSLKSPKWHKKWYKRPKIEIAQNYLKIGAKPISGTLIMNMGEDYENIVTKENIQISITKKLTSLFFLT